DSGNCTADIDINESQQFSSISQNCKIIPGQENVVQSHAKCLGCWHPIDSKSLELLPIVTYTIQQFNNQSKHSALFKVGEMIKAYRQVVNGWNYHLEYLIKETNCSKNEFPDLSPACSPLPGGQQGSCIVYAYVDNRHEKVHPEQECKLQVEEKVASLHMCPGCTIPIATDRQELEKPLEAAVESFNAKSKSDFYFKVVKVTNATTQIVSGIMYRFYFSLQKTNCSKADVEKPNEYCTAVEDGELLFCHGSVYVKPWKSLMIPQVTCTDQKPKFSFRAPPGFTPFRGASRTSTQIRTRAVEEFYPDPRGPHTHENRRGRGNAHGHRRGHGHGHKKPTESSSEEAKALPPVQTPSQLPTSKPFLKQEVTSRSPHKESVGFSDVSPTHGNPMDFLPFLDHLPDLPEPPKCPGSPWKPKRDPEPQDNLFKDFDLLDALKN
ncbi:kininogen-1-like, partial [Python bivittatus]|uniref:Kininogen-1-like n=1 Tax=Python bivittatus TaxID=176946 RepID=A0A9F5JC41_PYTBI